MKANELRIGNYIFREDLGDRHTRTERIIALNQRRALISGPISVMSFYEHLKPIPLTEEWLLKFGFKYDGNWHWTIGENPLTKDHMMDICWILGAKYPFYRNGHFRIEYVHQLQNLYFALTNQELTLK